MPQSEHLTVWIGFPVVELAVRYFITRNYKIFYKNSRGCRDGTKSTETSKGQPWSLHARMSHQKRDNEIYNIYKEPGNVHIYNILVLHSCTVVCTILFSLFGVVAVRRRHASVKTQ